MNALRVASFSLPLSLLTLTGPALTPWASLVCATPQHTAHAGHAKTGRAKVRPAAKKPVGPAALTFQITTRFGYTKSAQTSVPDQTVQAKVSLRGNSARIETNFGGSPSVLLVSPPYVYRLLPVNKVGVAWHLDEARGHAMSKFNPQDLLRDPASIRTMLTEGGAVKQGSVLFAGTPCDVYLSKNFREPGTAAKAWLRRSDSLPVRLDVNGGSFHVLASWSNYQRPSALPASLFVPPFGYKIRMASGQPPFSGM